jgi:hypothetical protein
MVKGLGFIIKIMILSFRFRVFGLCLRAYTLGFMVKGSGFRVQGLAYMD